VTNIRINSARLLATTASLVIGALALAGCAGKAPDAAAVDGTSALKVGIFVDNAFGDGDFFDQAALAQKPLEAELHAKVRTYEGQLQAQNFGPLMQDAADANDLVFVLGFEAIDAMVATAKANPKTQFVFIDGNAGSPDIVSAVFNTQQGCFMAGALAATVNVEHGSTTAGFIGGVNAPVVKNCESGYTQGVAHIAPDQTVAAQYVGSFVDPAKGSEIAKALVSTRGAYGVFSYAGLSGSGTFDAAKSGLDVAPIGVVADKLRLAPGKTPGSLVMGVDKAILDLAGQFRDHALKRGSVHEYGFAEGGWDMVYDESLVGTEQVAALKKLQASIAAGDVKIHE
jgi:basic membrane protein A